MIRHPPRSTLFPYPTLSRSRREVRFLFDHARHERRIKRLGAGNVLELSAVDERIREAIGAGVLRSEEHTSELQSRLHLVCRLLLEKKKTTSENRSTLHYRCC